MDNEMPPVATLVQKLMPNASLEEQIEATEHFRAYLKVVYNIFLRYEAEGRLDELAARLEKAKAEELLN
jgi:hypothetical protein